jgi:hypothetical protein
MMAASVRSWNALSGHPEASWSVLVHARIDPPPSMDALRGRLKAIPFSAYVLESRDELGLDRVREAFADRPYRDGRPLIRVAREPRGLVLAAHHSALDGLGLVALLGLALDRPVRSGARGLPGAGESRVSWPVSAIRLGRALVVPPDRVAPDGGERRRGDHLLQADATSWPGGTPDLVAAVAEAVAAWNAAHLTTSRRTEIAVGASRRRGDAPTLADESAYLRLSLPVWAPEVVRAALREAVPEPRLAIWEPAAMAVWPLARAASRRLGSTALVSNLGTISGPAALQRISFWPVAHGRSGVAVGAATVGERTTITLRARRSDFGADAGMRLLEEIAHRLSDRANPAGPQE